MGNQIRAMIGLLVGNHQPVVTKAGKPNDPRKPCDERCSVSRKILEWLIVVTIIYRFFWEGLSHSGSYFIVEFSWLRAFLLGAFGRSNTLAYFSIFVLRRFGGFKTLRDQNDVDLSSPQRRLLSSTLLSVFSPLN